MRRVTLCLLALLLLGVPALSRADGMNESSNPNDYTQEDSHPLRFASYFVTPVGFLLEWTVMRPIHWVATSAYLAPAFDSEHGDSAPAPIAELPPPDYLPSSETPPPLHEQALAPPIVNAPGAALETQPSAPSPSAETPRQPVLH